MYKLCPSMQRMEALVKVDALDMNLELMSLDNCVYVPKVRSTRGLCSVLCGSTGHSSGCMAGQVSGVASLHQTREMITYISASSAHREFLALETLFDSVLLYGLPAARLRWIFAWSSACVHRLVDLMLCLYSVGSFTNPCRGFWNRTLVPVADYEAAGCS